MVIALSIEVLLKLLECQASCLLELAELGCCGKAPMHAEAQRVQGGTAEVARKVFAVGGMPIVIATAYIGAL